MDAEIHAAFQRMVEKFGYMEDPLFPNDDIWNETVQAEWTRIVKILDDENQKRNSKNEN